MNPVNWKTSLAGVVGAFCAWVAVDPQWFHPMLVSAAKYFFPVALAALGWYARDKH